jgi:hypothetical protein
MVSLGEIAAGNRVSDDRILRQINSLIHTHLPKRCRLTNAPGELVGKHTRFSPANFVEANNQANAKRWQAA